MKRNDYPLLITEDYWANSQLSVVRYTGAIRFQGHEYWIVNKYGVDVFELSAKQTDDNEKAIPPGEPCDLVLRTLIPTYKALGRERFLEACKANFTERLMLRYGKSRCKSIEEFKQMVAAKAERKARKDGEI